MEPQWKLWTPRLEWASLVGSALCVVTRQSGTGGVRCPDSTVAGWRGAGVSHTRLPQTPPSASSVADLNPYPFPLITGNQEYNSFQCILWVILADYWTRGWFREPPNLALGVRSGGGQSYGLRCLWFLRWLTLARWALSLFLWKVLASFAAFDFQSLFLLSSFS